MEEKKNFITRLDRRIALPAALVFILIVFVGVWFVTSGGGDDDEGELMVFDEEGGTPGPPMFEESEIMDRVASTIAAMDPTPTPTPTPDIAATLQAQLRGNRPGPAVLVSPLDSGGVRNPFLTEMELEYLEKSGERIWHYTKIWFHLQAFVSTDPAAWSFEGVEEEIDWAGRMFETAPDRDRSALRQLGPVVVSYVDTFEVGVRGIVEAVNLLKEAAEVLEDAGTGGAEERESLARINREAARSLEAFDDVMSAYGCSICGELFRSRVID